MNVAKLSSHFRPNEATGEAKERKERDEAELRYYHNGKQLDREPVEEWDVQTSGEDLERMLDMSSDALDNIEKLLRRNPARAAQLLSDTRLIDATTGPVGSMAIVLRNVLATQKRLANAERELEYARVHAELATETAENMGPLLSIFFRELRKSLGR